MSQPTSDRHAWAQPQVEDLDRLIRGGQETGLPGKFTLNLQPGDILSLQTPGGGGWGDEPARGEAPAGR